MNWLVQDPTARKVDSQSSSDSKLWEAYFGCGVVGDIQLSLGPELFALSFLILGLAVSLRQLPVGFTKLTGRFRLELASGFSSSPS